MANVNAAKFIQERMNTEDFQGRLIMAEFVCDLREANDPNLAIKEQVIREAMDRLSVHGLEDFDLEVEALMESRREAKV